MRGPATPHLRRLVEEFSDSGRHVGDLENESAPKQMIHPIELVTEVINAVAEHRLPVDCCGSFPGRRREGRKRLGVSTLKVQIDFQ